MAEIEAIAKLVNQLSKLPGVGRKTAQRLAYHIIGLPEEQVRELAVAIFNGKKEIHFCPVCGNYTDTRSAPSARTPAAGGTSSAWCGTPGT